MYIKFCNFGPYADAKVPGKPKEEPTTGEGWELIITHKPVLALVVVVVV